ncbi:hypothetical protein [Pedobacter sp. SL55]|uniref:hypothetical protein n=1 Tax=Pedobacter sp. SL55 TaxID=2995161 RepID=UPI00226E240C|nr:hypothetical protein [Pedobacter sp. SL55]WAC40356.1 hypothetical protein OVA16_17555 [Pedobacter sp. SL55]
MNKKINVFLSLAFLFIPFLFSCDKEENLGAEFGQYAVAINYNGEDFLELHFSIDEEDCGMLAPVPNLNPTYLQNCDELKKTEQLINVFVLPEVAIGKHTLKVKTANGSVLKELAFEIGAKQCVFQQIDLSFN